MAAAPHRAVQNQAFCRTWRPRRTVRYRKRPCGVREVHLSARGRTRRWQQRRSSCRTDDGRKRKPVADSRGAGATESWAIGGWWLRDWAAGGREVSNNEQNNDLSCLVLLTGKVLFCLIINVLSATTKGPHCDDEWHGRHQSPIIPHLAPERNGGFGNGQSRWYN